MKRNLFVVFALLAFMPFSAYALKSLIIVNEATVLQDNRPLMLVSASPQEGEVLEESPPQLTLIFSQPILLTKSLLRVTNIYGSEVTESAPTSDSRTLSVALPKLGSGRYSVKWRARCRCEGDDEVTGNFHFTVK